ncbi:unnamed protein product, partial [Toxocara canis]|uniref:Protein aurora borealis n=1 Tax=Toxocara canis TaxID=6265 RepID=A0A183U8A7_TOXCA
MVLPKAEAEHAELKLPKNMTIFYQFESEQLSRSHFHDSNVHLLEQADFVDERYTTPRIDQAIPLSSRISSSTQGLSEPVREWGISSGISVSRSGDAHTGSFENDEDFINRTVWKLGNAEQQLSFDPAKLRAVSEPQFEESPKKGHNGFITSIADDASDKPVTVNVWSNDYGRPNARNADFEDADLLTSKPSLWTDTVKLIDN